MINFSQRDEAVPSALILIAIVIMGITLVFALLPRPSVAEAMLGQKTQKQHMYGDIRNAKAKGAQTRTEIATQVWTASTDEVSADILADLTAKAVAHSVKIGAFRPQRGSVLTGITELPFSVEMSGSYESIRAVMESLDAPGGKVVLRSVQIAASEEQSNQVTATLGLSAYIVNDPDIVSVAPKNGGGHA